MAGTKLTASFVYHVAPPKQRNFVDYKDDQTPGLYLRVLAGGSKRWVMLYRINGRRRNPVIAHYPGTTLSAARRLAAEWWTQIKQGVDPKEQENRAKSARQQMPTVSDFADTYIERYAKPNKRSWPEDRRLINRHVLPDIGSVPLNDVARLDILEIVDEIRDQGSNVQANRVLAVIHKLFNFAIERGLLNQSPVVGIKPTREHPRRRVLTDDELRTLWLGTAPDARMNTATRLALRLLMLTGQRSGEVCGLRRSEVDLNKRVWELPGERAKNGLDHVIPLSPQAVDVISEALANSWSDEYVFPAARGANHLSTYALTQALNRIFTPSERPRVHDIRRTVGTRLSEFNNRLIVDKVLNHADRSVGGIYDRYAYDKEKRTALEGWARRLDQLVTGETQSKVVELTQ